MAITDITTGKFDSAWNYVSFADTGVAAGTERLFSKDDTTTKQHIKIASIWLACATGGNVAVFDGSEKGAPLVRLTSGGDVTIGTISQDWDFRPDAVDMTNEDGTCLCISCTGTYSGFIKYGWGV